MTVMQVLEFMQEFTFMTNVKCLHSKLLAKLLMRNSEREKHAKTCNLSIPRICTGLVE